MVTKIGIFVDDDLIAAVVAKGGFSSSEDAVLAALRWYVSFLKRKAAQAARRTEPRATAMQDRQSSLGANHEVAPDEHDAITLTDAATSLGMHATEDEAVDAALREFHRYQRQLDVIKLFGTIDFDPEYDYKAARRSKYCP